MRRIMLVALLLVLGGIIPLVQAQCDTTALQLLLNEQTRQVIKNTDDSFIAYEQYNTHQLDNFLTRNQDLLKQSAVFLLIALFSMVLFTSSLWSLITMRKEKHILLMLSEDLHYQRKCMEAFIRKSGIQPEDVQKEVEIERQKPHEPTPRELKQQQEELEKKEKERQKELMKMQREYQKQQINIMRKQGMFRQQQEELAKQQPQYPYPYPYPSPQQQQQQPVPQQQSAPQQPLYQYPPAQPPVAPHPYVTPAQAPAQPADVYGIRLAPDARSYHL